MKMDAYSVAALFVRGDGYYSVRDVVQLWTEDKDARKYTGNAPVVAHPPCQRWGAYAEKNGMVGQDGGCFESARNNVRRCGGVLEHPAGSKAFALFGLPIPKRGQGWTAPDKFGGRSCWVYQGNYGHRAPKATWLYAVGIDFRELDWSTPKPRDLSHLPEKERKRAIKTGICQRLSKRQRELTPPAFGELLIELAFSASDDKQGDE
jgi:hypothetical protein